MNSLRSIVTLTHRYEQKLSLPTTPIMSSNLYSWFDATDPNGNGSSVPSSTTSFTTWVDKSAYKNNATAYNSGNQISSITYNNTGFNNIYPTFIFGSTSGIRFKGAIPSITGKSLRIFMVASVLGTGGIYGRAMTIHNGLEIIRISNKGLAAYRGNYTAVANNPSLFDTPLIWEFWFDGAKRYNTFLNGNSTTILSDDSTATFGLSSFAIGHIIEPSSDSNNINNYAFYGKISEILVYNGTLTTDEVFKNEAYLANKYGLKSTLPTSNPYRNLIP